MTRRPVLWAALCYVALTALFAYPFSAHMATRVLAHGTDTDLPIWTIGWDVHALTTRPWAIFDANIFFPFHNTLAYSENSIGAAITAAPIIWLTGNAMLAMNVVVMLSTPVLALGAFFLARVTGASRGAAFVCGLVAAFTPARFVRMEQFHVANTEWMPFVFAFLLLYVRDRRARDLRLAVGFLVWQTLTSGHGAAMTVFGAAIILAWKWIGGAPLAAARRLRDFGWQGALMLVPAALVYMPYRLASRDVGLTRVLDDWSINAASFFAAPSRLDHALGAVWPAWRALTHEPDAWLFPGFVPLLLAVVAAALSTRAAVRANPGRGWRLLAGTLNALIAASLGLAIWVATHGAFHLRVGGLRIASHGATPWAQCAALLLLRLAILRQAPFRARRLDAGGPLWIFLGIFAGCLWLALDRPFGGWGLINWLPIFKFVRVPSRFMVLGDLSLGVAAAFAVDALRAMVPAVRGHAVTAVVAALVLIESVPLPMPGVAQDPTPPAIDRWVGTQPGPMAILEAPLSDSQGVANREQRTTTFMLHSMAHWQPIFQGFSGTTPPGYMDNYWRLVTFPDQSSLDAMRGLGLTHAILHLDLVPERERADVLARVRQFGNQLELLHQEGDGYFFRVK